MIQKQSLLVALMTLCLVSPSAPAAVVYSYVSDSPSYDISSGTATVKILLRESLTDGSTGIIAADGGLFGAGFRVRLVSGTGATITNWSPSPLFPEASSPSVSELDDDVAFTVATNLAGSAFPTPNAFGLIELATLTMTSSGTEALFEVSAIGEAGNTFTLGSLYDLDYTSLAPTFIGTSSTVNQFRVAVPEPAAMSGLVLVFATLARRRRVRKRASWCTSKRFKNHLL